MQNCHVIYTKYFHKNIQKEYVIKAHNISLLYLVKICRVRLKHRYFFQSFASRYYFYKSLKPLLYNKINIWNWLLTLLFIQTKINLFIYLYNFITFSFIFLFTEATIYSGCAYVFFHKKKERKKRRTKTAKHSQG